MKIVDTNKKLTCPEFYKKNLGFFLHANSNWFIQSIMYINNIVCEELFNIFLMTMVIAKATLSAAFYNDGPANIIR